MKVESQLEVKPSEDLVKAIAEELEESDEKDLEELLEESE